MARLRTPLLPSSLVLGALLLPLACGDGADTAAGDGDGDGATGDGDGAATGGVTGDGGGAATGGVTGDGGTAGTGGAPGGEPGTARFFNVETGEPDPRFATVPASISSVELLPRVTLEVSPPAGAMSVQFSVGGVTRLDAAAPFLLTESAEGAPEPWSLGVGVHSIEVSFFSSVDGTGEPLSVTTVPLEITSAGTDTTPESGEHARHDFWVGGDGLYNTTAGDFAFIVLLPEGYDPAVKYPLVTFLHHGSDTYRGTDNNGLPIAQSPLFSGSRSITTSQTRLDFPAVILVPQLPEVVTIDGVTNEWAAFHSLSNATGDYDAAPDPSIAGAHVIGVVEDMLAGTFMIDSTPLSVDSGRVYLAGHSMGGFGTWDLLWRRPTLWAAGVPMAGYQDHESAPLLVDMPIWCFHHEIDSYNPFHADTMQGLIQGAGGTKMKLTMLTFDTGGAGDQAHFQTPNAAWNDEPGLFEWIFSQARPRQ